MRPSPLERMDRGMNQATLLHKTALSFGALPAVALGDTVLLSYAQLAERSGRLGAALAAAKLQAGDRVAIVMKNVPQYLEVLYGIWYAGLCAVPVNAKLHPNEIAYILENSGARLAFASKDLAEEVAPLVDKVASLERVVVAGSADYDRLLAHDYAAVRAAAPTDNAWLFYTSGTTGRPKGATLTHRNLMSMTMNYFGDVDWIDPGDSIVHAAPMSHGSGLYALPHVAKGAVNVLPESGGFEPAEALALIARWPGTTEFFAPTMVTRLLTAPELREADLTNLKSVLYGGGPMYVEDTLRALQAIGPKLVQIYGQGEAPMTITYMSKAMHTQRDHPRFLERLGSAGIARTDVEVKVFDAEDRELPAGELGEIVCRGDVVMAGYWGNAEATAAALKGGWLHTGDVGTFDADGFLTLKDRSKDMIISGGTNIYPREVEEVLLRHPAVLEVSVVGRPHADWGEEVVAFVVARNGRQVSPVELDRLCLDNIARFKRPKDYQFLDSLPKNNYGKVLKTELRQRFAKRG